MYFKFFISFKGEPHRGLPIFMTEPPSVTAYSGQTSKIWYNVICLFAAVLGSWDKGTLESFVLSVQYDRRGRLAAPDWR